VASGSERGAAVIRKVGWRLLPFLGLLYFVAFLDRVNVGFAALTMNADLALTATQFGRGAGIFFLGYVLFEVPSNVMLARLGARVWIARIMISWGLLSAGMAFVSGPWSFYVVRFLLGVAEAGFFPGMIYYLTCWFPAAYRARIVGSFMIALPLSSIIGAPLSTSLLSLNWAGLAGWQWMFLLEGIPAVLLGFAVLLWLTDAPERAGWLAPEERRWLTETLAAERAAQESVRRLTLRDALTSVRIWTLGLVYFGAVVGLYALGFWLPQIIQGLGEGLTNFEVGLTTVVPYTVAAIAMVLWSAHSDRTGERRWHFALSAFVASVALAASGVLHGSPLASLVALTVAAAGIYATLPVFWTLPTALMTGTAAAAGIALVNSIGNVGGFVGPLLVGYFKDETGDYAVGLAILAVLVALSGALGLRASGAATRVGRRVW
jgi:MFS transporter, ACS family, tartrate transporter